MPQIRPTKFTDFNDQPLNNAYVYVYKVGESYLDSAALLTLTDAGTGTAISNPFRTNEYGYPINSNSQTVNPTFAEVEWAVRVESAQNVEVKTFPKMIADNFNEDTEQSSVVDATFADLPDAKNANLTAYDTVYIQNETAGWEGTLAGPTTGFYAHKDGTTGAPGTGDSSQFFDSAGNGFTRDDLQRVDEAQFDQNTADIATNTASISDLSANLLGQQLLNWQKVGVSLTHSTDTLGLAFGVDANGLDTFVSVGDNTDQIAISRNGLSWTAETNPTAVNLTCVAYGDSLFMAVTDPSGGNNRVITSPDGEVWTEVAHTGLTGINIGSLAYNGSRWVFVNGYFITPDNIATSDDNGASWTGRTNPTTAATPALSDVIWSGTQFVAVGSSTTTGFCLTSPDGATWTEYSIDAPLTDVPAGIAYGNGTYVIPLYTTAGNDLEIYTSSDAQTWTKTTITNNNFFKATPRAIIFAQSHFVMISTTGEIAKSSDGVTWELQGRPNNAPSNDGSAITYGAGRFVIGGNDIWAGFSIG